MTAAVGITAAGVSAVAGTVDVPWWVQLLGGAAITGVATFAVRAIEHRQHEKVRDLWTALAFALAIPLGAVAYHAWFDPAATEPTSYELVVNGSDVDVIRPVGEPGSTDYFVFPPVVGGSHVDVDCRLTVAGSGWYRLTRDHSFLPADALHPVAGDRGTRHPHVPLIETIASGSPYPVVSRRMLRRPHDRLNWLQRSTSPNTITSVAGLGHRVA